MILAVASGNTFLVPDEPVGLGKLCTIKPEYIGAAKQAFYDFGGRPAWTERVNYGAGKLAFYTFSWYITHYSLATSESAGTATFSGRREGLALYMARLLRPLWKTKLTKPGYVNLILPNSTRF